MNIKLSLFITLVIGAVSVLARPPLPPSRPPPSPKGQGNSQGPVTVKEKEACFKRCRVMYLRPKEECKERCYPEQQAGGK